MSIQEKFDLKGRVAVVTGGAGLLGSQFCRTLAEAGGVVAVLDLDPGPCERVSSELNSSGLTALPVVCDLRRPESIRAAVATVVTKLGAIDILVNSAALDPKFDAAAVQKGHRPRELRGFPP